MAHLLRPRGANVSQAMQTVKVDPRAGKRVRAGHPWIFSNHVKECEGQPAAGEVVRVTCGNGKSDDLGTAFYNPNSLIALRHLSFSGEEPDEAFLHRRLKTAQQLRERLYPDSDCWRLCHGESDFLPGLVIDRLGTAYVIQFFSAGMERIQAKVVSVLTEEFGATSVVERNDSPLRRLEGLEERVGLLSGVDPGRVQLTLPPAKMFADPLGGQKTGIYLDQRENHIAAARHARGVAVYDGHSNAGGFGIQAALAGASSVVCVDQSEAALELAGDNARENGVGELFEFAHADVVKDMDDRHRRRERFGLVVLDPPSYTRSRKQVPQARRALKELNRRGLTLVEKGGVLVTSTCSHHITEETFVDQVLRAAQDANRTLRILERRSQAPDHPILAAMPESRYLCCLIVQVL